MILREPEPLDLRDVASILTRSYRLGLQRDIKFARLLRILQVNPLDDEIYSLILERLESAETEERLSPDPFRVTNPVCSDAPQGNIVMGTILHSGVPWLIEAPLLTNNTLIVGRPGGGKTNLMLLVIAQLPGMGTSVKIFDRKGDYVALLPHRDFLYWEFEDFYTNFLEPVPGDSAEAWINTFSEVLANHLDIRVAARTLVSSAALELCDRMNSKVTGIWPTYREVYELIRNTRYPIQSHHARQQETICNRSMGLLLVFGDHICSRRRLNWQRFVNSSWAISLQNIPTDYQNVFVAVIMAKLLRYRMVNNLRSPNLEMMCVFDEASTMFRKYYETQENVYLLTDYLAKCREFGTGMLLGTQTIANMADSAMANTAIKIMVGGCGLGSDYQLFAAATGMTPQQSEFLKQLTRPGQACAREPRYQYPFTLEIPRVV